MTLVSPVYQSSLVSQSAIGRCEFRLVLEVDGEVYEHHVTAKTRIVSTKKEFLISASNEKTA